MLETWLPHSASICLLKGRSLGQQRLNRKSLEASGRMQRIRCRVRMASWTWGLVFILMSVLVAGCAGGGASPAPPSPTPTITSVTASCAPTQVQANQTSQCSAGVLGTGNFSSTVNWTVQGGGSINSAGLYTAPSTVPNPAQVTITATSVQDPTKSGTASVTITQSPPPITVSVSPTTATVPVNGTQQFTASVQNDAMNRGVTWSVTGCVGGASVCGSIAPLSTASGAPATYTAPAGVPPNVQVKATSVNDPTKSATATVTISSPFVITSVTVSPSSATLQVGSRSSSTPR